MIRLATVADAAAIRAIYAPYIETTVITFELTVPPVEEFERRIGYTLEHYPYLVYEQDGKVIGYAYAGRIGPRAAFDWSVELSVYLDQSARRQGVGKKLYLKLMQLLALQGYCRAFGVISLPNEASCGLHEALGFDLMGIEHKAGYKLGRWIDVIWYEKALRDQSVAPSPIRPITEVLAEYKTILQEDALHD